MGIMGFRPPCDRCRRSGNSGECELADGACTPTCSRCQRLKIKCTFEVSTAAMERSASREKRKQSEKAVEMNTLPRGVEKRKWTKKMDVDATSMEEIKVAMGGFLVAGPSNIPNPVAQVLVQRLGEVIAAIDCNTKELARLGNKVDGFAWEMKRMADVSDHKGKGRARPEVTEDEEEKPDESNREDREDEELRNEDGQGKSE